MVSGDQGKQWVEEDLRHKVAMPARLESILGQQKWFKPINSFSSLSSNMASRFAIVAALLSAATQAQEPAAAPIIYTRDSWHVVENGSITDILSYSPAINATRDDNSPVALHINTRDTGKRNQTAPYLYGLMHEDISHSGDGGIYAEMLSNRAFQGSDWRVTNIEGFNGSFIFNAENPIEPIGPVITAWESVGDNVRLNLDRLHPISDALQNGIQLDIPFNATGLFAQVRCL